MITTIDCQKANPIFLPLPRFSPSFPRHVDLEDLDPFLFESHQEQFLRCQAHKLPYYLIAIAECGTLTDAGPHYRIYSAAALCYFRVCCEIERKPFITPEARETIHRIHYFALECFKTGSQMNWIPIPLSDRGRFTYFRPEFYERNGDAGLALDALNPHVDPSERPDLFQLLKRKQTVIAKTLECKFIPEARGALATHSSREGSDSKRNRTHNYILILEKEQKKWSWCSSQPASVEAKT